MIQRLPGHRANRIGGNSTPRSFRIFRADQCFSLAGLIRQILPFAICLVLSSASLHAQTVPPLINYQGRLSDPDGSPLPTADYALTFKIFDAPTNGTLVWGPQIFDGTTGLSGHGSKIPVVQGYFNVMLGPVDVFTNSLLTAFSGSNRFVEITVGTNNPILPRQQILAAPFAFQAANAANAAKLAGADWSAVFGTNDPVNGKISTSKLASRQVGTNVGVGGVALSLSSGDVSQGTGVWNVPNMTVTITTSGRPVFVSLVADQTNPAMIYSSRSGTGNTSATIWYGRDGTNQVQAVSIGDPTSPGVLFQLPPSAIHFLDFPSAGVHVYHIHAQVNGAVGILEFHNVRLAVFEL